MNGFAPQSIQTMSELMDLAAVPFMVLAPRDGKPVIEVVQDSMVGSYRLTQDHVKIHDKTMANLQMVNTYFSGALPEPKNAEEHMYAGRQALSQILPPSLFIEMKNKKGQKVVIQNSEHVSGAIDKPVFHSISRGILPILFHDYGPFEVKRFLDNLQRLVCRWLMSSGFSVGISDLVIDKATGEKLKQTITTMKTKAYKKIEEVRKGNLDNNSIFNNEDFFEREIINILNETTKMVGSIGLEQIDERTNRMINMVKSGSKGKETNVAQMIACVGQQNVDGKRVAYGFTDRTLPHYNKFDDGPEARGFVENSFISGLTPQEVFFHAMGGREGLIDTAVKTSETGYIQRRLVKAMEDCKVYYDHTVRNATGVIVQFMYGEDGMDGTRMETQIIPTIEMSFLEIEDTHLLRQEDDLKLLLTDDAYAGIKSGTWERCREHFMRILDDREFLITKVFNGDKVSKITFPIPFERILKNAHERIKSIGVMAMPSDLTPDYILDTIEELKNTLKIQDLTQGTRFLHILLNMHLSPKPLLTKYNIPKAVFDYVVSEIRRYYIQAIAHPGEMVGIVAAQTIGENSTQLVLDSFHSSGTVAAVKATSGVPRFKELLSVSKNIKTPILTIFLKDDIGSVYDPTEDADGNTSDPRVQQSKERAIKVMQSLEITRLVDILDASEIYWDPSSEDGMDTAIQEDQGFLEVYRAFQEIGDNRTRSSEPWVLRMKLNKVKMYRLGLTMLDVYVKIHNAYNQVIDCMFSDDNADELIFRVRMKEAGMKDIDSEDTIAALKAIEHNLIHNVLLKGMKGIKKVSMHMKTSTVYDDVNNMGFKKRAEWVLDTDGSNLVDILANPNVDAYRTFCNDVWEIYHTLGIEAARNAIYNEIMDIIGEDSMNYRHMSLLLDTMTNRGQLMSVDRHGINRGDVGPLAKSSFEETTDMLINASIFSEYDRINGVSANIMLGQLPPCGTGDSEVMLDEDEYIQAIQNVAFPVVQEVDSVNVEDAKMKELIDRTCSYEAVALQYKVPEKRSRNMPKLQAMLA